jgi:hypothetical protein
MLLVLGKISTLCCFRHAGANRGDRSLQADHEYGGSGPMRFVRGEWVPGARFGRLNTCFPRSSIQD